MTRSMKAMHLRGFLHLEVKLENYPISLEGVGPTILGMGLTNRPHIRHLDPVSWVGNGEDRLLKIPLLILGKWKHRTGILDFSTQVIDQMQKNFQENVVGHDLSLDNRHKPELGSIAWIKRFDLETRPDGKKQFSAFGKPTPEGEKTVDEERYRYASIEFHPNWENPLISALSSEDELVEYNEDFQEDTMDENAVTLEQYQAEIEARQNLEQQLEQLRTQSDERITALQSNYETVIASFEERVVEQLVSGIILEAEHYRDEDGRGHGTVLLEWAKKVLTFASIGEGDEVVVLEESTEKNLRGYLRKTVAWLLENLPGSVPFNQTKTSPDKVRDIALEDSTDEENTELAKSVWEM